MEHLTIKKIYFNMIIYKTCRDQRYIFIYLDYPVNISSHCPGKRKTNNFEIIYLTSKLSANNLDCTH